MCEALFDIVLYQPEIPPNTGSVMRLAANIGAKLSLIEPLGFELSDARLRRAGLDYREFADVCAYPDLDACLAATRPARLFAFSAKAPTPYVAPRFQLRDALLFGPETSGLPAAVLARVPAQRRLRIPMRPHSRSLNLANAVAVAAYEAWRQLAFA